MSRDEAPAYQRGLRVIMILLAPPVMLCIAGKGASEEVPVATLCANSLRARILDADGRIKSVHVVYRSYYHDNDKMPKGAYLHRIVVAKGPYCVFHVSAHGHDALDWRDDFYQQRAYITPEHLYNEWPVNRTYIESELKRTAELPGSLPREWFFLATGIWPLKGRKPPRPDGQPYMLGEVGHAEEYAYVRPRQELMNGHWCHVLERKGYDRLWIDIDRGCALLAREMHSRHNGALVQRIELGEHREVAPGIWMPRWMRNLQYDFNAPTEEGRKRSVLDARHIVLEVGVNDVDDSVFQFRPLPGTLRRVSDVGPGQTVPGVVEHLDNLSQWVRRHSGPGSSAGMMWGWGAALGILASGVAWECWGRVRCRRGETRWRGA